jgi:hypothetical protein
MSQTAPKDELLRALGRLVRGLSALFWGLPLALLVCIKTATNEWLRPLGILPPVLVTGMLFYGLTQLGYFQKQERVWMGSLERAKILALVNVGLSPFIYWWNKLPDVSFYSLAVTMLMLFGIVFLYNLNQVLQRLAAMLPDETLRTETRVFGNLNISLLSANLALVLCYILLQQIPNLPDFIVRIFHVLEFGRQWLLVFLILLPTAMTMTLIWKIKEVIFASVFSQEH